MIRPRKILVVSEEPDRHQALVDVLRVVGYDVQLLEELRGRLSPDLAVVDTTPGDMWSSVSMLASRRLILIVADAAAMRRGFALGADDCVIADAHEDEIVARCEAVLRRTSRQDSAADLGEPALYADSRLWINFSLRHVWAGGHAAQLTPREHRLLQYFIRHSDTTLTHERILEEVWERAPENVRPTEVLKQYIWRLRQKVESDPEEPEIIVTDPGKGYRFVSHPD